jgi:hypothetical protein
MTPVRDDIIPENLSAVILDAAGALPSGAYGLERVMRRRRSHRRRAVAGLALVSVMVMAAAVAIPLALSSATVPEPAGDQRVPAQRLFYYVGSPAGSDPTVLHLRNRAVGKLGEKINIRVPAGIIELDGRGEIVVRTNLGPETAVQNVVGLPDGGLAALDNRHRKPAVNNVPEMVDVLTVVAPDGTARMSRIVGKSSDDLRFVGATGVAAYRLRGNQLVRHEFTSGEERPVAAAARVGELVAQGWSVDFVVSDRVVLKKDRANDVLATALNLSGAGETAPAVVCAASLEQGKGPNLMLAPDGRHLACYTTVDAKEGGPITTRLTITELSTGRRVTERDFASDIVVGWYETLGWTDDHTLRLGLFQLPPGVDRLYELHEVLKLETIKI